MSFDKQNFSGKRALVRVDFNVPLNKETFEITDNTTPKPSASRGSTFPVGIGLFFVLSIKESISLSYHIFIAPDAPAPIDIQRIEMKKKKGCMLCGASTTPQIDVNTASVITLGFSKDRKSPTELLLELSI